ncbi:hypothetical protein [Paractinoplanes maris]|uniref:hypothetical protein n=1 Tax=Paractinoplanes maris TaxID=1734446 RepID=UPI002020698E|nr:hypothetical protein [Actinoplanes maris]
MERIILFDGACPSCSALARKVESFGIAGLSVRSLDDPEIVAQLTATGFAQPDKPSMIRRGPDGTVDVLSGIQMRADLARLVGIRRSNKILELVAAETRARAGRFSASRRRVLFAAGGAAAGAAMAGSAARAAEPGNNGVTKASPALIGQVSKEALVAASVKTFGAADYKSAIVIDGSSEQVFAFAHANSPVTTFVGLAPGAAAAVVSIRPLASEPGFEYVAPDGKVMAVVRGSGDKVTVTPGPAELEEFSYVCFANCLGAEVSNDCFNQCISCLVGPFIVKAIACPLCAACAGSRGIECIRRCR